MPVSIFQSIVQFNSPVQSPGFALTPLHAPVCPVSKITILHVCTMNDVTQTNCLKARATYKEGVVKRKTKSIPERQMSLQMDRDDEAPLNPSDDESPNYDGIFANKHHHFAKKTVVGEVRRATGCLASEF